MMSLEMVLIVQMGAKHSFFTINLESGSYKNIECSCGNDSRNVLQFLFFKWSKQGVESLLKLKCSSIISRLRLEPKTFDKSSGTLYKMLK